jgi:hypothetical protein
MLSAHGAQCDISGRDRKNIANNALVAAPIGLFV